MASNDVTALPIAKGNSVLGTGFLTDKWPLGEECSLVTAFHVVVDQNALDFTYAGKRYGLSTKSVKKLYLWKNHDVAAFSLSNCADYKKAGIEFGKVDKTALIEKGKHLFVTGSRGNAGNFPPLPIVVTEERTKQQHLDDNADPSIFPNNLATDALLTWFFTSTDYGMSGAPVSDGTGTVLALNHGWEPVKCNENKLCRQPLNLAIALKGLGLSSNGVMVIKGIELDNHQKWPRDGVRATPVAQTAVESAQLGRRLLQALCEHQFPNLGICPTSCNAIKKLIANKKAQHNPVARYWIQPLGTDTDVIQVECELTSFDEGWTSLTAGMAHTLSKLPPGLEKTYLYFYRSGPTDHSTDGLSPWYKKKTIELWSWNEGKSSPGKYYCNHRNCQKEQGSDLSNWPQCRTKPSVGIGCLGCESSGPVCIDPDTSKNTRKHLDIIPRQDSDTTGIATVCDGHINNFGRRQDDPTRRAEYDGCTDSVQIFVTWPEREDPDVIKNIRIKFMTPLEESHGGEGDDKNGDTYAWVEIGTEGMPIAQWHQSGILKFNQFAPVDVPLSPGEFYRNELVGQKLKICMKTDHRGGDRWRGTYVLSGEFQGKAFSLSKSDDLLSVFAPTGGKGCAEMKIAIPPR